MTDRLQVGVIAGTHGIRGDVKVFPTTDDPKRFYRLRSVILTRKGTEERHEVSGVRLQDKFVILHLSGIDSPEQASVFRRLPLMIDRSDAMPLPEGRYYIADLIGMRVVEDSGQELGRLTDVLGTGANDVYEVSTAGGGKILIPATMECVPDIDIKQGVMTVHLLPGMRE